MSVAPQITVRRQVIDAQVAGSEQDGLDLRRRLGLSGESLVAEALEHAFRDVETTGEHIIVDRLEVDIEHVSLARFDDDFGQALRRQLAAFFVHNWPPQVEAAVDSSGESSDAALVVRRTLLTTVTQAFLSFLGTGRLPWSFQVASDDDLESMVVAAWAGSGGRDRGPPVSIRPQLDAVLSNTTARRRLVLQFSPDVVDAVVGALAPELLALIRSASTLDTVVVDQETQRVYERGLRLAALDQLANAESITAGDLVMAAWRVLGDDEPATRGFAAHLETRWPGSTARPDQGVGEDKVDSAGTRTQSATEEEESRDARPDEAEGLSIEHAGLVLLHPFLPRYFSAVGLIDAAGDRLFDPQRAVCLLHHLATGDTQVPEYATVLAKVLCGVRPDEPIDRDPDFSVAELDESIALLRAVVGHWDALRSTTPGGLRAEFLKRAGLLSVDVRGEWALRVEHRTVDVLLGQLPWNLSMVRTPWMEQLMRVEWEA